MQRIQVDIRGEVQGVGFRPHVFRIANELSLTGFVQNNAAGVYLEAQGSELDYFIQRLQDELPPLASIDSLSTQIISLNDDEKTFVIRESRLGKVSTKITPDASVCDACLHELFDPSSAYYHYPFINCTHCGPRYTITRQLPYDRKMTSMDNFVMCETCRAAYENPGDRRYHAQPVACQACGPRLSHSVEEIAQAIRAGKIVAVKALGGYQLMCDASNANVVERLRANKSRPSKPFAVMVLNVESARQWVQCSEQASELLASPERPIVLLPKKQRKLPDNIAPHLNTLGVMLPYTPLHYLLFHALSNSPAHNPWLDEINNTVLVVTSANPGDCPLIKEDNEVHEKLVTIADMIVSYNREIVIRVDDTVMYIIDNKPAFVRRARGFVPRAIQLPHDVPVTLALGGYLKNTVCISRGREAFVSQHVGDLNNREVIAFYRETIEYMLKMLDVKPECVAHDLHPDFYSSKIAAEFNVPAFAIQHHHAHLAACAAEYGVVDNAIGLALDGFGLGENFESWGGELMLYVGSAYKKLGSLKPFKQPGGDVAAREPWRMAASALYELGRAAAVSKRFGHRGAAKNMTQLIASNINSPLTSSAGRLFDAASALLGICEVSDYEGHAAMALEGLVRERIIDDQAWIIEGNELNVFALLEQLIDCDPIRGANLFHGTLSRALSEWIKVHALEYNIKQVLLSGGCFLNRHLSEWLMSDLRKAGLTVFYPRQLSVNDGGLSLGQAWIAANKMMEAE